MQCLSQSSLVEADEVTFVVDFLRPPQGKSPSFDTDELAKKFYLDCDAYHFSVMENQPVNIF